jgi:hypothetical protein
VASRSTPAWRSKASATVRRSGSAKGSQSMPRKVKRSGAHRLGRQRQQAVAVGHQGLVGLAGPVPLQHRELGAVQRAALAVAPNAGEIEDLVSPAASSFLQANSGEVCR